MRAFPLLALPFAVSLSIAADLPKDLPAAIPLWPNGAPGSEKRVSEQEKIDGTNVSNVHNPTITPFAAMTEEEFLKAPKDFTTSGDPKDDPWSWSPPTGVAVLIAPGGGHSKLCLGHEGYALAQWFQHHAISAFVLKYRLAREPGSTYTIQEHAMADTRRALRIIRSRAEEWHIKPDHIGIIGFSAGGELAAFSAMKNDPGKPDAADPIERMSCRPDFQGLIYPGTSGLFTAEKGMPPLFIACGYSDRPDIAEGMAQLYLKYKAAGVKAELHIYSNAGHGFGYRPGTTTSAGDWPLRFTEWLTDSGFMK